MDKNNNIFYEQKLLFIRGSLTQAQDRQLCDTNPAISPSSLIDKQHNIKIEGNV